LFEKLYDRYLQSIDKQLEKYCLTCITKTDNCKNITRCLRNSEFLRIKEKYNNHRVFGEEIVISIEDDDEAIKELVITESELKEEKILALREYYKDKNVFPPEDIIDETSINLKGNFGRTPLHDAVLEDDVEKIIDLLNNGADITVADNNGHTPLILAKLEGKEKAIKILSPPPEFAK
jgi:hypothetical protein